MRRPLLSTLFPYTTLFRSHAEAVFTTIANNIPELKAFVTDIRERAISFDRHPEDIKIFPAIMPIVDRKSTRLNSSHVAISYAVFCVKKKKVGNALSQRRKI